MRMPRVRVVTALGAVAAFALIGASSAFAWSGGLTGYSGQSGANGWYTSNVTVNYAFSAPGPSPGYPVSSQYLNTLTCSGSDGTSNSYGDASTGYTSLAGSVTLTQDGQWTTQCSGSGSEQDWTSQYGCGFFGLNPCLGNWYTFSYGAGPYGVKIDKTPPMVTVTPSRSPDSNGWYNHAFGISLSGSDSTSGVSSCGFLSPYSGGQITVSSDGYGSVTGRCTNGAGLTAYNGTSWKYDATKPTISAAATSSPNANGWYNGDVVVQFSCSDALSGIASCPANQTLSSEGTGVSSSAEAATDKAGNTSAASNVVTVNIDKTAPTVTVTGVSDGALYSYGSVPTAGCDTTDGLSGVASSASLASNGGPYGQVTVTCSGATDKAGNSAAAVSASYWVDTDISGYLKNGSYNFNNQKLVGAYLDYLNLAGATAKNADFSGGSFIGTDLSNVNFSQANLSNADFSGANLSGANLSGATLAGATGLGSATLTGVIWKQTTCPDGTISNQDGGTCANNLTP